MELIIGIDPGKSGGFSLISNSGVIDIQKSPTIGSEIDINAIVSIIKQWKIFADSNGYTLKVFIEDVHALFGASAKSTFQFGRSVGILQGIISSFELPVIYVQPKKWQSFSWKGVKPQKKLVNGKNKVDTKKTSLLAAKNLFPSETFIPDGSRTPQDGIVDATLIAYYGLVGYNEQDL